MRIYDAARITHEANKYLCWSQGDYSQPGWVDAPEWQVESAIEGVKAHLAALRLGTPLSPSDSHNKWLDLKKEAGWKYGPDKDPVRKEHPCFLPYDELPAAQKAKDYLFGAIVKALFDAGMLC
jgi:hypothetical protein